MTAPRPTTPRPGERGAAVRIALPHTKADHATLVPALGAPRP
ncbi:hypothetical protein [Nonomuraea sp. NPDC005501]